MEAVSDEQAFPLIIEPTADAVPIDQVLESNVVSDPGHSVVETTQIPPIEDGLQLNQELNEPKIIEVESKESESDIVTRLDEIPVVQNQEPEVVQRDPNLVAITLRPMDKDWVMGADWEVDFHNLTTIVGIREYIEKVRGISRHRIQLRLKGKVLPRNREIWTLRRFGIYDGYTIQVEPTLSGAWLWEPKQYYIDKLIREAKAMVEATATTTGAGRINLDELSTKLKPPPCIKCSLRVFLRQYPEHFYIHTDTTDNTMWVHLPKRPYQLPTFGNFSVEIGTFQYYKPKRFDWEGNKDIDDMYKIETLPEEELEASPADGAENTDPAITAAVALTEEQALAEAAATAEANARQVALQEEEDDQGERGGVVGGDSLLTGSEELAPNEIDQLFG